MSYSFEPHRAFAAQLDREDVLSHFRQRFYIPDHTIYMDGNSLGLMPRDSEQCILRVIREWKELAIRGWMAGDHPWFYLPETIGRKCARIVGARPEEVILTGSTTVNIHALISTFYQPRGKRTRILADALNFPSDIYALRGQIRMKGMDPEKDLILIPGNEGRYLDERTIVDAMTDEVALVFLPSVLYRSGQLLDMPALIREAHARDILIGFDCCHSAGAVPHHFSEWDLDFAVWCSYKYMNGGPGSPAFLYVNRKHFQLTPLMSGWYGCPKDRQFDMSIDFEPARSAGGWQISTQGMLSAAPVESALDMILEAGIEAIRDKSKKITAYLAYLIDAHLSDPTACFRIGTPMDPDRRSGHIALVHPTDAVRIGKALLDKGVVPDFRPPDIIRMAPVPLYNTFSEVFDVVQILKDIMDTRAYEAYSAERGTVA